MFREIRSPVILDQFFEPERPHSNVVILPEKRACPFCFGRAPIEQYVEDGLVITKFKWHNTKHGIQCISGSGHMLSAVPLHPWSQKLRDWWSDQLDRVWALFS